MEPKETTICQHFLYHCKNRPEAIALMLCSNQSSKDFTWADYFATVHSLAAGLLNLGLKKGDRIGIMSKTRLEWSYADMAILSIGAVTVPLFHNTLPEDVSYILKDAKMRAVFIERPNLLKDAQVKSAFAAVPNHIFFEGLDLISGLNSGQNFGQISEQNNLNLESLIQSGREFIKKTKFNLEDSIGSLDMDQLATIIYTSGTTGRPKGVSLGHRQMVNEAQTFKLVGMTEFDRSMPFLPFAHVLGRIEIWGHALVGYTMAFGLDPDRIRDNLVLTKPSIILAVPRLFEKIHSGLLHQIENQPVKKLIFAWAVRVGVEVVERRHKRQFLSLKLASQYVLAKKLVFSKILDKMGGKITRAVCGGAGLDPKMALFFEAVGITIFEGYGLTETTAAVTVNTPSHYRHGSVGKPIGKTKIKIAADGEILVNGPLVMTGYYQDPEGTAKSLNNGWFHTGDIGEFTEDGYLRVTDRKKDLIKTSNGKYVAPQKIESMLKTHNLISQVHIVGHSRKYITALITLNPEQVHIADDNIKSQVANIISLVNARLGEHELIKDYKILSKDFTVESGEITPSMKIRKLIVEKNYKSEIDSLYH